MYCKNCRSVLPENARACPVCGAMRQDTERADTHTTQVETEPHALIGKEYQFVSSMGFGITGYDRIYNKVTLAEDRMYIETKPKRKNVCPVILFEDILAIDIKRTVAMVYLIWALLVALIGLITAFVAFGIASIALLLMAPLFLWLGLNQKITVSQRNGVRVELLERSDEKARAFQEDMKKITKIR